MGFDTFTDMDARERLEAQLDARDAAEEEGTFFCESCAREYPGEQFGGMTADGVDLCLDCWEWWKREGWKE